MRVVYGVRRHGVEFSDRARVAWHSLSRSRTLSPLSSPLFFLSLSPSLSLAARAPRMRRKVSCSACRSRASRCVRRHVFFHFLIIFSTSSYVGSASSIWYSCPSTSCSCCWNKNAAGNRRNGRASTASSSCCCHQNAATKNPSNFCLACGVVCMIAQHVY